MGVRERLTGPSQQLLPSSQLPAVASPVPALSNEVLFELPRRVASSWWTAVRRPSQKEPVKERESSLLTDEKKPKKIHLDPSSIQSLSLMKMNRT